MTATASSLRIAFKQGTLVPLLASALAGATIITPVLVVLCRSFTSGRLGFDVGLNLANYMRVFADLLSQSVFQTNPHRRGVLDQTLTLQDAQRLQSSGCSDRMVAERTSVIEIAELLADQFYIVAGGRDKP